MKIVHFTSKIVFGNFLDIWRFFSGHTAHDRPIVRFISTFLFKIGDENSKNLALAVTHWSSGCFRLWKSVVRIQRMAHLIYCSTMLKSQKEVNLSVAIKKMITIQCHSSVVNSYGSNPIQYLKLL